MPLCLPAIDISKELALPDLPRHRALIFSNGRKLLVLRREVLVVLGSIVSRKLIYDEDIVCATYSTFQQGEAEGAEALIVCLRKSVHVYYPGGNSHIVSIPFALKTAFPFDSGLLLERDNDQAAILALYSQHRFFTLVDPIGELRVVTTSSTSVVASGESLMYFPKTGLGKSHFLCATFNLRLQTVSVYHVKSSMRTTAVGSSLLRRKRNMSMATPNPSRILEDELYDSIQPPFGPSIQPSMSLDKKRTSTLLSGASSIARMGSEPGFSEPGLPNAGSADLGALRKDLIWTKVGSFNVKARKLHLTVTGLVYEDWEAIVVSNRALQQTTVYTYRVLPGIIPTAENSIQIDCLHAVLLNHARFPGWLVAVAKNGSIQLVHPILEITLPPVRVPEPYPAITSIASTFDNKVALRTASESRYPIYINLVLEPKNELVSTCMKVLKYFSGSKLYESLWVLWRSALMLEESKDEWKAYVITILSLIYPFEGPVESALKVNEITELLPPARTLHEAYNVDYSLEGLVPFITVALHLVYEETRLDVLARRQLNQLGALLTQLTLWLGWLEQWVAHYMIDATDFDTTPRLLLTSPSYGPPNIFDHLISLFERTKCDFVFLSQLAEESDQINQIITPRTHSICYVYEVLAAPKLRPSDVVTALAKLGLDSGDLESYPPGIRVPLNNCLLSCQKNPEFEWNNSTLDLVGRRDLAMLTVPELGQELGHASHEFDFSAGRDANSIIHSIAHKNENLLGWDEQSEADRLNITKLIFDKDRKFYEITTLLHQTRIQATNLVIEDDVSEYDSTLLKRETASLVALRTLSIPMGRAALFYAGRMPLLTEKFPIPKFNLNTLIAPSMTTIVLTEGSISDEVIDWGHFHNGVSSGLSISPDAKCITGSWIIFNKPAENNAQHAGFLLGLGLNGHLKLLEEWHIYNYLGPKHPMTSIGLLIGMAASLRGTMETKLTKVLSVHAVALLPQGANDLNVPIVVQSAGLIGIGLLYLETLHRRMSETLLSQLGVVKNEQESYMLAAGMALGLINLGKGNDLRGLTDTRVVDKLLTYAVSMKDSDSIFAFNPPGAGAVLALGLIYLRTENSTIAAKLDTPDSSKLLDYVRPDVLLLRKLCKNLIMWKSIEPTRAWVESQIPVAISERDDINDLQELDSDQVNLFSILGGSCLALAIKFASSGDLTARDTLLHYLDITMIISITKAENYDEKRAIYSALQTQSLLALCLSVVMAGSGDIETFRRLRVLHGRIEKNHNFGAHMASSLALGILFLGGSQYAFGDSNLAIAALVVSLYPVFPSEESEEEVHLQVLRHFWALSIEPRCLVVRDVRNGSPIKVPVTITYRDGTVESSTSPKLLRNMSLILSIEVRSELYFDVSIDFLINSEYLEQFKKSLTIFVLRKLNYELLKASVGSLLENRGRSMPLQNVLAALNNDIKELLQLKLTEKFLSFEKKVYLHESNSAIGDTGSANMNSGLSVFNIADDKLQLRHQANQPQTIEDVHSLKVLFAYTDCKLNDEHFYIDAQFFEALKQDVWSLSMGST